jgi:hypothetical protein
MSIHDSVQDYHSGKHGVVWTGAAIGFAGLCEIPAVKAVGKMGAKIGSRVITNVTAKTIEHTLKASVGRGVANTTTYIPQHMTGSKFLGFEQRVQVISGQRLDYSRGYLGEKYNFIDHAPKEYNGPLSKPLRIVSYHSEKKIGDGRSLKYWTPLQEGNALHTIDAVKDRFALLNEWGPRTHVSVAEIPAGTNVTFLHGRAILKEAELLSELRPGGGIQYCFKDFDPSWVKSTLEVPK